MATKIATIDMKPVGEVIKDLGLDRTGAVQQYATHRAKVRMDMHVPFRSGVLRRTAYEDYDKVVYPQPYARYLYRGKLMVDPVTGSAWARKGTKKKLTEVNLKFNGAPQRGSHWDQRMINAQGEQFYREIQKKAEEYADKRR